MKKLFTLMMLMLITGVSAWAFEAGTYTIKPYSDQTKFVVPSASWAATGGNKTAYASEATFDNGGEWSIQANGSKFYFSPAKTSYARGYLNPWGSSSNNSGAIGCWRTADGEDLWTITPVESLDNVYTISGVNSTYMYYNSSANELYYNKPGTLAETNYFVIEKVVTPAAFPEAGTYYLTFKGKDSGRPQYLYHDLTQADGYTLASSTQGTTNAYIWRAVCDGTDMTIRNGQGQEIGMRGKHSDGTYTTNVLTYTAHSDCYYLKPKNATGMKSTHNCLNQSNSSSYANAAGTYTVTSWSTTSGPDAADNHWYVTEVTDKDFYDVVITGGAAADGANYSVASYANYNGQLAANGGFFAVAKGTTLEKENIGASALNGYDYEITITGHTISVVYTQTATPVNVTYNIFVEGVKVAEKIVEEMQGLPTTFTLEAPDYVNVGELPATVSETSVDVLTTYKTGALPFKLDGTAYTLQMNRANKLTIYYDPAVSETDIQTRNSTHEYKEPVHATQDYYKWVFGGNWYTGYTIKNVGTDKYITFGAKNVNSGTHAYFVETPDEGAKFELRMKGGFNYFRVMGTTNGTYISNNGGDGTTYLTTWASENNYSQSDGGAQIIITEAIDIPEIDWAAFETKLTKLQQHSFGEGLGEYADIDLREEFEGSTTASEMIPYYAEDLASKDVEYYEGDMEQMDYILNHVQINQPKAGSFLRIKGHTSGKYISGNATSGQVVLIEDANENSVLYLDENNHLIGYVNGRGFSGTHSVAAIGSFETHTFSASPYAVGKYLIKSNYSGSKVLCDWTDGKLNRWGTENDTRSTWVLEEIESLPVLFKGVGHGYATLFSPVALDIPTEFPEGYDAYTMMAYTTNVEENNALKVDDIKDGVIPANTGVVLYFTGAESNLSEDVVVNFPVSTKNGSATSTLSGTYATINAGENSYVFALRSDKPGFYKYSTTEGATLAGFKAYYENTTSATRGFALDFGSVVTAISQLSATTSQPTTAFDLAGRRVSAAQKGILIQNGNKVIR